jgi:hypothetical protein
VSSHSSPASIFNNTWATTEESKVNSFPDFRLLVYASIKTPGSSPSAGSAAEPY